MSSNESKVNPLLTFLCLFLSLTLYFIESPALWRGMKSAGLLLSVPYGVALLARLFEMRTHQLMASIVFLHAGSALYAYEKITKSFDSKESLTASAVGMCALCVAVAAAWAWKVRGKSSLDFKSWVEPFSLYLLSFIMLIVVATNVDFSDPYDYYYSARENSMRAAMHGLWTVGVISFLLFFLGRKSGPKTPNPQ